MNKKIGYSFALGAVFALFLILINGPKIKIETSAPVVIDVKECGAIGNGIADDAPAFQKAVDSAIKTYRKVYVPPGKYKLSKTIVFANRNATSGNFGQAYVVIFGDDTKHSPGISILQPTFKDAPVFAVHLNKGSRITGLFFDGKYRAPSISLDSLYRSPIDTYGDSTCRDSRYSPYTAIAIDPFRYNLPPDGGYPTLQNWYGGQTAVSGSTGVTVEDCTFRNFTIGAIVSPNGYTLNAELITFKNIRVNDCKFAFVGCQAQEKDNLLEGWEVWGKVRVAFVWGKYGAAQPGEYKIRGVNIAGNVVEIVYRPSQGFFPLSIDGAFAENVRGVGYWNTSLNDVMRGSIINLYYHRYIKGFPDNHLNGGGVSIQDTYFRYYGQFNLPALVKGQRFKYSNSPNGFNYVNPIKGLRYYATDPDYQNGFKIDRVAFVNSVNSLPMYYDGGVRKLTLPRRSPAGGWPSITSAMDSARAGDIVVFYQGSNLDYTGLGEIMSADSSGVRIEYISPGVPFSNVNVGIFKSVDSLKKQ